MANLNWAALSKAVLLLFILLFIMSIIKIPVCFYPTQQINATSPKEMDIAVKENQLREQSVVAQYHTGVSMYPFIKPGEVCLCEVQSDYKENDVVSFHTYINDNLYFIVHRIININPSGEIITQGDNNKVTDPFTIKEDQIFCKIKERSILEAGIMNFMEVKK